MQNPDAILTAAKSGHIPATWRVLRPTRGYPASAGCGGAFFMFFILIIGGFVSFGALMLITATRGGNLAGLSFLNSFLSVPLPGLIAVGVGVLIVGGLLNAMRAIRSIPYSYLVFTPEGAVQAIGPRKITMIDYAAIDLINTRIQVNTTTHRDAGTGAVTGRSTSVSVWGELHYRDGRTVRFSPASRFGSAESIMQRLINGHTEYQAMVGTQRLSQTAF
jgi:hypothetical protein